MSEFEDIQEVKASVKVSVLKLLQKKKMMNVAVYEDFKEIQVKIFPLFKKVNKFSAGNINVSFCILILPPSFVFTNQASPAAPDRPS